MHKALQILSILFLAGSVSSYRACCYGGWENRDMCCNECPDCCVSSICSTIKTQVALIDPKTLFNFTKTAVVYTVGNCTEFSNMHVSFSKYCDRVGSGCSTSCASCFEGSLCKKLIAVLSKLGQTSDSIPYAVKQMNSSTYNACQNAKDTTSATTLVSPMWMGIFLIMIVGVHGLFK